MSEVRLKPGNFVALNVTRKGGGTPAYNFYFILEETKTSFILVGGNLAIAKPWDKFTVTTEMEKVINQNIPKVRDLKLATIKSAVKGYYSE